jgi:hypothetical protein
MRLRTALVVILVVFSAACSGDDATDGTSGEPGTTAPVVTEAATTSTTIAATTTTTTLPAAEMSGSWIAELSHIAVEGPCPSTPTQRGPVTFEQDGDRFTLTFGPDFDCDPIEACAFTGTIDGNVLTGSNGGVADPEGGVYESSFVATWDTADHIEGTGQSTYSNTGVVCTWDTRLVMDRG